MSIQNVVNQVISLFLIIIIGMYGAKKGILTEKVNKGLSEILLKISLPFLVVSSFNITYDSTMASKVVKCFIYSFIFFIVGLIISYLFLMPLKDERKKVMQFANVFSNCSFMGFPIIQSVYGHEGIIYASIYNMFFCLFVWTYGVMLYSPGKVTIKDIKKVLVNPGIVAVYIGIVMMALKIQIPEIFAKSISMVGGITTPISMLIIGGILIRADLKKAFKDWTVYYTAFIKLLIIPITLAIIMRIIGDDSIVANSLILIQAMPAAALTSIIAESYDYHKEYAAIIVFITTLLSIVTFPLILSIIS